MELKEAIVTIAEVIADLKRSADYHQIAADSIEAKLKDMMDQRDKVQHDYDKLRHEYARLCKEVYPND